MRHVIEHIENTKKVIHDIYKLLNGGGLLIIEVPNQLNFNGQRIFYNDPTHKRYFTPPVLKFYLRKFKKVKIKKVYYPVIFYGELILFMKTTIAYFISRLIDFFSAVSLGSLGTKGPYTTNILVIARK